MGNRQLVIVALLIRMLRTRRGHLLMRLIITMLQVNQYTSRTCCYVLYVVAHSRNPCICQNIWSHILVCAPFLFVLVYPTQHSCLVGRMLCCRLGRQHSRLCRTFSSWNCFLIKNNIALIVTLSFQSRVQCGAVNHANCQCEWKSCHCNYFQNFAKCWSIFKMTQ